MLLFLEYFSIKDFYSMSRLPTNVVADTTLEPYGNFEHAEQTLEPIYKEIDSEAPRRSKKQRTTKPLGDDFTIYLVDDTPKSI
jgi:hypothetical protein